MPRLFSNPAGHSPEQAQLNSTILANFGLVMGAVAIVAAIASLFTLYDGEALTARLLRIVTPLLAGLALIGAWAAVRFYHRLGIGFFLILVIALCFASAFPIVLRAGIHAQSLTVLAIAILLAGLVYGPSEAKALTVMSLSIVGLLYMAELFGWFGFNTPRNSVTAPVARFFNFIALFVGTGWLVSAYGVLFRQTLERVEVIHRELSTTLIDMKLADEALHRSTQLLEASQAAAKLGGWELDLGTNQLFWTAETYRIHDTSPQEFNPTVDASVGHYLPESRRIITAALQAAMERGEGYDLVLEILTAKGRRIDVRTTCTVTLHEGRPVKLTGIFQDITAHQRGQKALAASEAQLRHLMENLSVGIVVHGPDTRILLYNQTALALLGLSGEQMLGKVAQDLSWCFVREDKTPMPVAEYPVTRVIATRDAVHHLVLGILHPLNNDCAWVLVNAFPEFASDGQLQQVVVTFADITARKQTEAALIAAKEAAESANVAKSQFLATMSHEIRTPLNVMKGMAYAMRGVGLAPKQEKFLAHIDAAGTHLLSIISDLLDVAKIEAGKLELEAVEINVGQIAADIVDMLQGDALHKNIHLVIEMQAVTSPLLGDATRLRQALLNYLNNALKFTETGTITLRVRAERESDSHALMRFEVQDTGIGINAQTAARLFAPFEQADKSDTRQHGGTGLGLVITKRIAELMGGSAGVESVPGVGSTFWFTALLQRPAYSPVVASMALPAEAEISPEQILRRDFAGARILLVEDDATTRMIFMDLLEELGLIVDTATDGTFAVDRVANQAYAIIVMDMQMPKMSGLEATRHIRATTRGMQVPIIMLTGNVFEETKAQCLEAGANDFVNKPVEPEDLFALILKWLTITRELELMRV